MTVATTTGAGGLIGGVSPDVVASFPMFDFSTPVWVMDPAIRSSPSLHWE